MKIKRDDRSIVGDCSALDEPSFEVGRKRIEKGRASRAEMARYALNTCFAPLAFLLQTRHNVRAILISGFNGKRDKEIAISVARLPDTEDRMYR